MFRKAPLILLIFLVGCSSIQVVDTCLPTWRIGGNYLDLDCSTGVDVLDVQLVAGGWRGDRYDVDGDGITNIIDIMLTSEHIGDQAYLTGWYSGFTPDYPYEWMTGSLLTMPYISERYYSDFDVGATLQRMRQGRVQGLLELERRWVRDADIASIESFVQTWDSNPSIYGWYIYDEPLGPVPLSNFLAASEAIRRNSSKPIAVAFCCSQSPTVQLVPLIESWYDGFDILMYDWYPIYDGTAEFEGTWPNSWSNSLDYYEDLATSHGKKFIPVLQGHGCKDDGSTAWGKRDPTDSELSYLFWTSAVRDTVGALWFAHYRAMTTPGLTDRDGGLWCTAGLDDGIRPKIESLHSLAESISPAITGGIASSTATVMYKYSGDVLIAVNESDTPKTVNFALSTTASTAVVVGESRVVPIIDGYLQDSFSKFEAHIYRKGD